MPERGHLGLQGSTGLGAGILLGGIRALCLLHLALQGFLPYSAVSACIRHGQGNSATHQAGDMLAQLLHMRLMLT